MLSSALPIATRHDAPALVFDEVYEAEVDFVWRSARALGAPASAVDDVVQEIFLVIHRRLDSFEGRSSRRSWVYGIVRNVVRAHRRAQPVSSDADPEEIPSRAAQPEEAAARSEAARVVIRLLDALDDDKREVFVLAELEGLSAVEIASMLGEKTNTIYSRLRLAREEFAAATARYRSQDRWRFR